MLLGLFFLFHGAGIVCLVAAQWYIRESWRPDIAPYGLQSRTMQVFLHPERFVTAERLGRIKPLHICGLALIFCGLLTVLYDVVTAIKH